MSGDSKERYGSISRLFHWGMSFLIGWQLLKFFDRINDGEHWVGETLVPWHVSIGSVLLLLVLLRIIWAARQRGNRPEPNSSMATLIKAGHFLLYAGMVAMPVTGVMYLVGKGYGWRPFGVELIARGGDKIEWMISVGSLHSPIAWLLAALIVGHIGIAVLHHFVKKDGTLRRMF